MNRKVYRSLPLESLNELLYTSVGSMLNALDPKDGSAISYKASRKHVVLFLELIKEKKEAIKQIDKNDH